MTHTNTRTLIDVLHEEIERNQDLVALYQTIPTGAFGATLIQADIDAAVDALASGDVVAMLRTYQALKENAE